MRTPGLVVALALPLVVGVAPAAAADGGPTVTVAVPAAGVSPDAPTAVDVAGQGFQVVQGGFGGIYVLFGWVDDPAGGSWRPSAGGISGVDYRYAVDDQARDNAGYQVFVAFPGSSTQAEANGGELAADGSWSARLTIPGATVTALDAAGDSVTVDCRTVTCGVITVGAHGVANAHNETFTPVTFADSAGAPGTPTTSPAPVPTTSAPTTPPPAVAAEPASSDRGGRGALPWLVAGAVVVLAAAAGVVQALRRRRDDPGPDQ